MKRTLKLKVYIYNIYHLLHFNLFLNFSVQTCFLFSLFMFIATNFLFIAGPVVVMPSTSIKFLTVYPPNINSENGEWCVTRDRVTTTLGFKAGGYSIKTGSNQPITQEIEIKSAAGNGGAYQLSVGTTKSNSINVFVDGI